MLRDKVKITIQSGRGGNGSLALYSKRAIGGDGGAGGDVYLQGSSDLYDLRQFDPMKTYKAKDGGMGLPYNKKGQQGEDLVLLVPLVTEVLVNGKVIHKIKEHGQKIKILDGGVGVFGSVTLKRFKNPPSKENCEPRSLDIELVLKLQSDIIFIGYPNAGKSSILNALTEAKVKTAPYAFTTLFPQLGLMNGVRLMDLPGLTEGTSEGKGVGTKFVKHTENCKLVAHFVSLENEDPIKAYESMREEVKRIDENLYNKPEIIVLTKTDDPTSVMSTGFDEKYIDSVAKKFEKEGLKVVSCSILDDKSIERVKEIFMRELNLIK